MMFKQSTRIWCLAKLAGLVMTLFQSLRACAFSSSLGLPQDAWHALHDIASQYEPRAIREMAVRPAHLTGGQPVFPS